MADVPPTLAPAAAAAPPKGRTPKKLTKSGPKTAHQRLKLAEGSTAVSAGASVAVSARESAAESGVETSARRASAKDGSMAKDGSVGKDGSAEPGNENAKKGKPNDFVVVAAPERIFTESESEFLKLGFFLEDSYLLQMGDSVRKGLLALLILLLIFLSLLSGALFGVCPGKTSCFCSSQSQ